MVTVIWGRICVEARTSNLHFFNDFLFGSVDIARVYDTYYVFVFALYMGNSSPQYPLASTSCIARKVLMSCRSAFPGTTNRQSTILTSKDGTNQ